MSDLFDHDDTPPGGANAPEFTVSEISGAIKRVIEGEFSHVRIRGEVGRVARPGSGHLYFDLKDDRAVIAAVCWKGQAARLTHRPEEGLEVIATGRLTTFPGQSRYQLIVDDIQPAGAGALMAMLEQRRKALAAEGLFDPARKKPLPYLPEVIGVITSPSGAVIRDILHRLRDRFPRKVLIWPVAVQGQACAPDVARAIAGFNAFTPGGALPRPDLLIVARGGGSVEDLWGFNEEIVVRAAAASKIPLISAVGHETDTTLIDHAADMRAPTPTAAAELAVPVRFELMGWTAEQGARLGRAAAAGITQRRQRLQDLGRALPRLERILDGPRQRLDRATERLGAALIASVQLRRIRLGQVAAGLHVGAMQARLARQRERAEGLGARRAPALARNLDLHRRDLARLDARRDPARLAQGVVRGRDALTRLELRLSTAARGQIATWQARRDGLERMRQTLGYTETLARGYAVVRSRDGAVLTRRADAARAPGLEIEFADGKLAVSKTDG
ncbi:MAG: exodeoxyribonuclease VII large subunit [Paracoccaceae bacterium]